MDLKSNSLYYKTEYQDESFPVNLYRITRHSCDPPGRGYRDLHWHDAVQFTLVLKGTLMIQVGGQDFSLEEGDGIFINSGRLHITTDISENGEYVSLDFPEKIFSFYPGSKMEQKFVLPYTNNYALTAIALKKEIDWQRDILSLLWDLAEELTSKKKFAYEYSAALKIAAIWHQLISNIHLEMPAPLPSFIRRQERIQTLIAYIQQNYSFNISINDIADSANISMAECFRCFCSVVHLAPHEYLTKYRINRSIELLNETSLSITEISCQVGYNYTSQFIKSFKMQIGMTPKEYRGCHFAALSGKTMNQRKLPVE